MFLPSSFRRGYSFVGISCLFGAWLVHVVEQDIASGLSESTRQRLRDWLEQEPLALYRDPSDPTRIDVVALTDDLTAQVRTLARAERERIEILGERLALQSEKRIETAMHRLREESRTRTDRAQGARRNSCS